MVLRRIGDGRKTAAEERFRFTLFKPPALDAAKEIGHSPVISNAGKPIAWSASTSTTSCHRISLDRLHQMLTYQSEKCPKCRLSFMSADFKVRGWRIYATYWHAPRAHKVVYAVRRKRKV